MPAKHPLTKCRSKQGYETHGDATRVLRMMLGFPSVTPGDKRRLNVFECRECGLWHVGRSQWNVR